MRILCVCSVCATFDLISAFSSSFSRVQIAFSARICSRTTVSKARIARNRRAARGRRMACEHVCPWSRTASSLRGEAKSEWAPWGVSPSTRLLAHERCVGKGRVGSHAPNPSPHAVAVSPARTLPAQQPTPAPPPPSSRTTQNQTRILVPSGHCSPSAHALPMVWRSEPTKAMHSAPVTASCWEPRTAMRSAPATGASDGKTREILR